MTKLTHGNFQFPLGEVTAAVTIFCILFQSVSAFLRSPHRSHISCLPLEELRHPLSPKRAFNNRDSASCLLDMVRLSAAIGTTKCDYSFQTLKVKSGRILMPKRPNFQIMRKRATTSFKPKGKMPKPCPLPSRRCTPH